MTVEERLRHRSSVKPEMCSLNMGSMNFALFPLADRYQNRGSTIGRRLSPRHRRPHLPQHFPRHRRASSSALGEAHGTRFEHECYDVGHLYNLAHFVDRGLVKPPFFVQMIFGILGGIGADMRQSPVHEGDRRSAFRRPSILVRAGRRPPPDAVRHQAAMLGGNVRVGLEDSLYIGRGRLARAMPSRSARSGASSRNSATRSPHPRKRARSSA